MFCFSRIRAILLQRQHEAEQRRKAEELQKQRVSISDISTRGSMTDVFGFYIGAKLT